MEWYYVVSETFSIYYWRRTQVEVQQLITGKRFGDYWRRESFESSTALRVIFWFTLRVKLIG